MTWCLNNFFLSRGNKHILITLRGTSWNSSKNMWKQYIYILWSVIWTFNLFFKSLFVYLKKEAKKKYDKETEKYCAVLEKHLSLSARKKESHLLEVRCCLWDFSAILISISPSAFTICLFCRRQTIRLIMCGSISTKFLWSTSSKCRRSKRGRCLILWSL